MISRLSCNIKSLISSLILLFVIPASLLSQGTISGVVNEYGRVTSIGTDFVIIDDPTEYSQFSINDTILLLQMKGVKSLVAEDASYGNYQTSEGNPGAYEFLIILSKEDGIRKINFRNNIIKSYNVQGDIQIVRVPSYYSAVVNAELTCAPWDSTRKTGGVLTMIVGTKLSLNANINVSGKGFAGGIPVHSPDGLCIESITDPVDSLNRYSYNGGFFNSGAKGESHAYKGYLSGVEEYPIYPKYSKGKGANYTGGGGGNGRFSGGGGGSLRGAGGIGGDERSGVCVSVEPGGLGGISSRINFPPNRVYLGGGGGGSTYLTGSVSSAGGKGGGIIIILCETLDGNGYSITANGETPAQATGDAGAGGGGAGGTIAIHLQSFTTDLTISARGGNGGNSDGSLGRTGGTGGGGGGGMINVSIPVVPVNIIRNASGGNHGTRSGISDNANNGENGDLLNTFVPFLNGFLFNTIKSSVTLNQVDSICSNVIPKEILGTAPVGGSGDYQYLWQKSLLINNNPLNISGSDVINYTPTIAETSDFVYFRRVVIDNVTPSLTDTSKWVRIKVQPAIINNDIGKDTIICYNQDPLEIGSLTGPPEAGNGIYSYRWIRNSNNIDWVSDTIGVGNGESYDPPVLTTPAYYKRRVVSGRCIDYSSAITITVLPNITGNIFVSPTDSIICEGFEFNILNASEPGGGDLVYKYIWQDSTLSGTWSPASGLNSSAGYIPDTSLFTAANEKRYFRRVIYSGEDDVCSSFSSPVLLTRYPKITNNIISAPQVICEGTRPALLSGLQPSGGAGTGTYTYIWQDSTSGELWSSKDNSADFHPDILTSTKWYRRTVESSVCKNFSIPVMITVQPSIKNNNISLLSGLSDSTICTGSQPYRIIGNIEPVLTGGTGSNYTYKWKISSNNTDWNDIPSVTTSFYQPGSLNSNSWFKRVVTSVSGICKDSANNVLINVLPAIVNTIPSVKEVCINTPSLPVEGLSLSGGQVGNYLFLWQDSTANHDWTDLSEEKGAGITLPLLSEPAKYRRQVWSGPNNTCFSISNPVNVSISTLPYPVYAGMDTILNSFEYLYNLRASEPESGIGQWSVISSQGSPSFDNNSLHNTIVRNLSSGLNMLAWKMVNGACEVVSQVKIEIVNINVPSGISPDGNGQNDVLNIKGLDFSIDATTGLPNQNIELTILNSAGAQIYYTSNAQENEWKTWEGKNTSGNDLPEGTYYYLLKIVSNRTENIIKKSGFIILKRY